MAAQMHFPRGHRPAIDSISRGSKKQPDYSGVGIPPGVLDADRP